MTSSTRLIAIALPTLLLTVACRPAKAPDVAPEAAAAAEAARRDSIAAAQAAAASQAAEAARVARADSVAKSDAAKAVAARVQADSVARAEVIARAITATRSTLAEMVFFDYDQADLTTESREALDAKLPILRSNPAMRIRIAGHTDERGSDEYNIALGQRRAAAAKRYLAAQGIAEARMDVVSYGEERPLVEGSDESAWSQNRRDEFEIVVGAESIRVP